MRSMYHATHGAGLPRPLGDSTHLCCGTDTEHSINSSGELIHLELNLLKPIPSVQPRLWAIRGYGLLVVDLDLDLGANFALVASRTYGIGGMVCGRYGLCSTVSYWSVIHDDLKISRMDI